jgi:general secretion pathway protein M
MAALLENLGGRFRALSMREQVLVAIMAATAALLVVVLAIVLVQTRLGNLESRIAENDRILLELATQGEKLKEAKAERDREEARFDKELPPLPGLLERLAGESGIEIPESRELPDDPTGKKWVRKSVEVRLRRVGLRPFVDFMVKIKNENRRIPLAITHLSVKKRASEPDSYDIDITVSAYQKASAGKKKDKKKVEEPAGGKDRGTEIYGPEA